MQRSELEHEQRRMRREQAKRYAKMTPNERAREAARDQQVIEQLKSGKA